MSSYEVAASDEDFAWCLGNGEGGNWKIGKLGFGDFQVHLLEETLTETAHPGQELQ